MTIIKTDGSTETIDLQGKKATLDQLQKAVGGYIEAIPGTQSRAYFNEDGRRLKLTPNLMASLIFGMPIVGNVVRLDDGDRQ